MKILHVLLTAAACVLLPKLAFAQCDDRDLDGDGFSCLAGDCNDNDNTVYPSAPELCDGKDNDCNNVRDDRPDGDGDGVNLCQGDCDDNNPNRYPGNTEVCDGVDNDCNAGTQDATISRACYQGPPGTQNVGLCRGGTELCNAPGGWSGTCGGQILPTAEQCDNQDHDCNGANLNGFANADNDPVYACQGDCDDNNPNRYPGNTEVCDGVDNDCNPATLDTSLTRSCYTGPGGTVNVGVCRAGTETCSGASGWSGTCNGQILPTTDGCEPADLDCDGIALEGPDADGDGSNACVDCDDNNPNRRPGATEVCDGQDNDCDAFVDERNNNGDPIQRSCYTGPPGTQNVGLCRAGNELCNVPGVGWSGVCGGQVLPTPEQCDQVDHDCTGGNFNGFQNLDGDPVPLCMGDCDDNDPNNYPGNTEICDGRDNNCINGADENFDNDGDGWTTCGGDCNDNDPGTYPGAPEICDGRDNDCDTFTDEDFPDVDMDGFRPCGPNPDCNDNDNTVFPGAVEQCDNKDNDCDALVDERNNAGDPMRRRCYTGPAGTADIGTCRLGWEYCVVGVFNGTCAEQVVPRTEQCDGQDDDCDGRRDEDFDLDGDGFTSCENPVDCNDGDATQFPGNPELCDGKDNDCDNLTDEAVNGTPLRQTCYTGPVNTSGVGLCRSGYHACNGAAGYDTSSCIDQIVPTTDICDGDDNNCDGTVDETFDVDGDGFTSCGGDCDDNNRAVHPDALEVCNNVDDDCDTIVDGTETLCYEGPVGTATVGLCRPGTALCVNGQPQGACNDQVVPVAEVCDFEDNDCDGDIDEDFDQDADGVAECAGDCDDNNPFKSPNVPERCDCDDNNCNGEDDEDGFGGSVCEFGACHDFDGDGFTNCEGDCNDRNSTAFPGAAEVCGDQIDNDCDGLTDEDTDEDNDGFTVCGGDCDDRFAQINPAAAEVCDAFDNNCNDQVDEGFDLDGDFATVCAGDCDDTNPNISPFRREICGDNLDNDCDGTVDNDTDLDGDGFTTCDGDCNDYNSAVYPGAPEVCDGHDNDCNGRVDEGFDVDRDTFATCFGDCNDADPAIHPFAPEVVDGQDNNCNGATDEGQDDNDGDGFSYLCGDCNDNNPDISPQTVELCDGRDNDCDGVIDRDPTGASVCAACNDVDLDGVTDCDGDCDDTDPEVAPGRREVCDGKDNTCDDRVDFDIITQTNVCIGTGDAGTAPDVSGGFDAASTGTDSGIPGGEGVDLGLPPELNSLALSCGCSTSGSERSRHGPWTGLLLLVCGLGLFRGRRRTWTWLAWGTVMLLSLGGCTSVDFASQDSGVNSDASDASTGPVDAGRDSGVDLGTDTGVVIPDAGPVDLGPFTEGACRLQDESKIRLETLPMSSFMLAVHREFSSGVVTGIEALTLDDPSRSLRALAMSTSLPLGIDASDPLAASKIIDGVLDAVFLTGIPGVQGVATRVDETSRQSFFHEGRPAARTLRRVTMSNVVLPSMVRNGLIAGLGNVPLRNLGGLPAPDTTEVAEELLVAAYVEIDPNTPPSASIVVALGPLAASPSIATRLNDLTNGTHVAPPGSVLELRCETSTASALRVDFLWVVDNSASMQEEQQALAATADSFFDALQISQIDFRLGVVTTDGETLQGGGFTNDLQEFKDNVRVGINGNGDEQGLEYGLRALERTRTSTNEDQRLRDGAVPVVIFFSDEDAVMLRPFSEYVDAYRQQGALSFAIVGPRPRGCRAIGRGVARVGERYIRAAEELGGTSASICSEDFTEPIREILIAAAGEASQTRLMNSPISGSLEVAFPTVRVPRSRTEGFDYEPSANSILFFGPVAPREGTPFRATFQVVAPFVP